MSDKKILYILDFEDSWSGGINYFVNQILGLMCQSDVQVYVLGYSEILNKMQSSFEEKLYDEEGVQIGYVKFIAYARKSKWLHFLRTMTCIKTPEVKRNITQICPDVVVHMGGVSGKYKNICQVAWIPDFQHIEQPENFSRFNRLKRTIGYFFLSMYSDKVMLSSQNQANVFNKLFFNTFKRKVFINRFRVRMSSDYIPLSEDYSFLAEKEIVLFPSAFWVHKNHRIVLDLIKRQPCRDCVYVFTGGGSDYRDQEYSHALRKEISSMQQSGYKIYFFSNITSEKLASLLANASILINPSYYEGWSTIVEEAKSYNIQVLLSNIATHQEQFGEYKYGQLFNPYDIDDLEKKFKLCLESNSAIKLNGFDYSLLIEDSFKTLLENYEINEK